MKMSPLDIQQQRFRVRFRGFDVREVDSFLEQVADALEDALHENEHLLEENRRIISENQQHCEQEQSFKQALLNSQKVLEQMKSNAQKSAELLLAQAEVKAEKILQRAHNRLAQLYEEIAELKRQRTQIEVQIRSVIESHAKMLDLSKEEMGKADEIDDKLQFLKKSNSHKR